LGYCLSSLEEASKAGNRKKLQAREYNRATVNNLPIPLVPWCEESDKEPKANTATAINKMIKFKGLGRLLFLEW
jgi:hypothetical protein